MQNASSLWPSNRKNAALPSSGVSNSATSRAAIPRGAAALTPDEKEI